jgi:cysteine protease IpaJ
MQQTYPNSCGAVGLLCASMEMGKTEMFAGKNSKGDMQPPVKLQTNNPMAEQAIYKHTSNAKPGQDPNNGPYSYPDRIVSTARVMGLNGEVQMVPGVTSSALKATKGDVVSRLQGSGVPIKEGAEPPLTEEQRRLRVVVSTANVGGKVPIAGGLHYIMERPNGTIMDPASGRNYQNLQSLNAELAKTPIHDKTGKMLTGHYMDSGVSVVLSPGS